MEGKYRLETTSLEVEDELIGMPSQTTSIISLSLQSRLCQTWLARISTRRISCGKERNHSSRRSMTSFMRSLTRLPSRICPRKPGYQVPDTLSQDRDAARSSTAQDLHSIVNHPKRRANWHKKSGSNLSSKKSLDQWLSFKKRLMVSSKTTVRCQKGHTRILSLVSSHAFSTQHAISAPNPA